MFDPWSLVPHSRFFVLCCALMWGTFLSLPKDPLHFSDSGPTR